LIPEVEVITNLQIEAAKLESHGLFEKFKDDYFIKKKSMMKEKSQWIKQNDLLILNIQI